MMRSYQKTLSALVFAAVFAIFFTAVSCDKLGPKSESAKGELRIAFAPEQESLTRSGIAIPDTSDFLLTIKDEKGNLIYDGKYGDSPESLLLDGGTYTVSVMSEEFSKPEFSAPQYGDEQCIVVPSGSTVNLKLVCTQLNSGVRLRLDSAFLDAFPEGVLILKSSLGRLVYGYSEKRIAYFKPGDVSLVLNENDDEEILMTRELKAKEILDLKISVAASAGSAQGSGNLSIKIDTLRNWTSDEFIIGGGDNGSDSSDALTVSEARDAIGEEDVWVCGYIVGGDLSSSSASFEGPFSSKTNLLLGPRSSTTDKDACLSVQLNSGDIRDALNLVENPNMLGRKILLKGNIVEAYYGIPGIKNITEYELL